MEGLEDVGAVVWEKPFQDQDLVASILEGSLGFLRIITGRRSLMKQLFVPKVNLHLVAGITNQEILSWEYGGLDYEFTR